MGILKTAQALGLDRAANLEPSSAQEHRQDERTAAGARAQHGGLPVPGVADTQLERGKLFRMGARIAGTRTMEAPNLKVGAMWPVSSARTRAWWGVMIEVWKTTNIEFQIITNLI